MTERNDIIEQLQYHLLEAEALNINNEYPLGDLTDVLSDMVDRLNDIVS